MNILSLSCMDFSGASYPWVSTQPQEKALWIPVQSFFSTQQIASTSCFSPCNTYRYNSKVQRENNRPNNGQLPFFSPPNSNKKQWAGADPVLYNGVEVFTTVGTKNCFKKIQSSNSLSLLKPFFSSLRLLRFSERKTFTVPPCWPFYVASSHGKKQLWHLIMALFRFWLSQNICLLHYITLLLFWTFI